MRVVSCGDLQSATGTKRLPLPGQLSDATFQLPSERLETLRMSRRVVQDVRNEREEEIRVKCRTRGSWCRENLVPRRRSHKLRNTSS